MINQKVLDRQLRKAGIVADIASDGAEALDKIDASIAADDKYRVVLMDLEMRASACFCCMGAPSSGRNNAN